MYFEEHGKLILIFISFYSLGKVTQQITVFIHLIYLLHTVPQTVAGFVTGWFVHSFKMVRCWMFTVHFTWKLKIGNQLISVIWRYTISTTQPIAVTKYRLSETASHSHRPPGSFTANHHYSCTTDHSFVVMPLRVRAQCQSRFVDGFGTDRKFVHIKDLDCSACINRISSLSLGTALPSQPRRWASRVYGVGCT